MTAYVQYGGTPADFLFTINSSGDVVIAAGGTAGVWTAATGGVALTDLQDAAGNAATHVTADTNGMFRFGVPVGTGTVYVDSGLPSGSRFACSPTALASAVATLAAGEGVTGPPGPAGADGARGPAGAPGPAGPPGTTDAPTMAQFNALAARVTALENSSGGGGSVAGPTALTATPGDGQIVLSWTLGTGPGITGQYLHWSPPSTQGGSNATLNDDTTTTYTVDHLTNTEAYTFHIAPITSAGTGSDSSSVTAAPVAPTTPGVPTGLTATPGDAQVALAWTASTGDPAGYSVRYRTSPSGAWTDGPGATATNVTVTGLTDGTAYDFQVAGYDSGFHTSAFCDPVTATPEPASGGGTPSWALPSAVYADSFHRADGPIGSTDAGSAAPAAWQLFNASTPVVIRGDTATQSTHGSETQALVDVGQAGGTMQATLAALPTGSDQVGFAFAAPADASEFNSFTAFADHYSLYVAGDNTAAQVPAIGDVLKVVWGAGSTCTAYVNGVQVASSTGNAFTAPNFHLAGLKIASASGTTIGALSDWSYSTATS